ncbi:MAG: DNA-binding domain-containing protein [Rhodobacterales bacterium]|nr:DNA-binding domain-containing protein [Rhodobacterales bacterium]
MTGHATGLVADFLPALMDPDRPVPQGLQDGQGRPAGRRFNVYRNNVTVSLTEALTQGFPAVVKLLGPEYFTAIARVFVQDNPPQSRLMMHYGAGFAEFLETVPALARLGYVGDVARLELALRRSYHAADAAPLDPAILGAIAPDDLPATRFTLAPAVMLIRSRWPIHAIWAYNMIPGSPAPQVQGQAQDVMITRPGFDPAAHPLTPGGAAFVAALMEGATLGAAHDAGASSDDIADPADFDPSPILGLLITGGAITGLKYE